MENRLLVTSSPHIRDHVTTRNLMLDVIIALIPAVFFGIYYFGLSAAVLIVTCIAACVFTEYVAVKLLKKENSTGDLSAVVTGLLLALNLPPHLPIWMAVIGCLVAIVIIKQLFGGIGMNLFNPAIGARVFLTISFAQAMTTWVAPGPDAVSVATPLSAIREGAGEITAILPNMFDMFIGNTGGSIGETSILALLIGGIWLLYRKVITWHIPVSFIGVVAMMTWILGGDTLLTGNPLIHVMTGGLMLGAIYMATDYTTTPMSIKGTVIFGIGCGLITAVIRLYGSLPEGVSFAILFMNILVPLIDRYTIPVSFGGVRNK